MYPKDGRIGVHPERGFQRARVRHSSGTGISSSSHIFTNNLKKGMGDMFIPFAHDPDLRSTVTSFHSRKQNGNRGQASPKSAKGPSEDPALGSEKANCSYYGMARSLSYQQSLWEGFSASVMFSLFNEVSPGCAGPGTQH